MNTCFSVKIGTFSQSKRLFKYQNNLIIKEGGRDTKQARSCIQPIKGKLHTARSLLISPPKKENQRRTPENIY